MSKYIVKNCPAYYYDEEFNYHICKQPLVPYEGMVDYCLNCPDCIIKQIVGLCKDVKGYDPLTKGILNLLESEEVE